MFQTIIGSEGVTTGQGIICLIVALMLGIVISMTYMKTGEYSRNFARTLIVMPVLISIVMTLVNGNLGTSVAVLGAFSLVRFRSMQGTSRDISYILFSMTVGLGTSLGYIAFAIVFTIFVCAVHFILQQMNFAEKKTETRELRITIPENLDYEGIFDDIFQRYFEKWELVRVKTSNLGSMYELCYHILIKENVKQKEMMDELRCRNGNLTIICGMLDYQKEEL